MCDKGVKKNKLLQPIKLLDWVVRISFFLVILSEQNVKFVYIIGFEQNVVYLIGFGRFGRFVRILENQWKW